MPLEAHGLAGCIGEGSTGAALAFPLVLGFFSCTRANVQAHFSSSLSCYMALPPGVLPTSLLSIIARAACLSARLVSAVTGEEGGREGGHELSQIRSLLWGAAAPGRAQYSSPQTPRTKQRLVLGLHRILLLPVLRPLHFCHGGEPASCATMPVLTDIPKCVAIFSSLLTDKWDFLAEEGFTWHQAL